MLGSLFTCSTRYQFTTTKKKRKKLLEKNKGKREEKNPPEIWSLLNSIKANVIWYSGYDL